MKKLFLFLFLSHTALCASSPHTNALIHAESPYLLHHAHNPVDWHPYNDKVWEKAKKENKLVFLSIGYSTCHWCHVMEEESFENEKIAKLLNKDYISIKVDKEEMPQVDVHFQQIHTILNKGRNGWPLTIILTPKEEVLSIATYVPAKDKYGIDGLLNLLPKMAKRYHDNEINILLKHNKELLIAGKKITKVDSNETIALRYRKKMQMRYDKIYPGFDKRPRFPLASHLNFLLDIYLTQGDKIAFSMVKDTLDTMANGGIYDQVEGGFYRYSTHPDWVIPHFEKMLYTEAELIPLYTKMFVLTHNPLYKKVVDETIKESLKIFDHEGLFYAATDADSEGREGGYFIYQYDEVVKALKTHAYHDREIEENMEYFDLYEIGNFEDGFSNPQFNTGIDEIPKRMQETKQILKDLRKKKTFPFIDPKVLTGWNAMMIKALFIAGKIDIRYQNIAKKSLEALLKKMYVKNTLYHQVLLPRKPSKKALLEDYAFLIDALLEGYMTLYEPRYLHLAKVLTTEVEEKFYKDGKFYLDEKHFALATYKDKYYTAPLSRFYHDMITLGYLTYDLALLQRVKGYLNVEKDRILAKIENAPEASRALYRLEKENIVLKSSKENLLDKEREIDKNLYPFLMTKVEKTEMFLLCNENTCFFYDKNISKVLKKVK